MRHPEIAAAITKLVDEERLDEAERLLPEYAHAVTEECISGSREQEFRQASEFVRKTLRTLKVRRAHLVRRITEADRQRAYLRGSEATGTFDLKG
jgi:hypothetical protein